jgi:hypothetical protein
MASDSEKGARAARAASSAVAREWWLEEGGEECRFCLQPYPFETERRCAVCEAPVCPACLVVTAVGDAGEEGLCPDCEVESD